VTLNTNNMKLSKKYNYIIIYVLLNLKLMQMKGDV
jgi:hypothetical protein